LKNFKSFGFTISTEDVVVVVVVRVVVDVVVESSVDDVSNRGNSSLPLKHVLKYIPKINDKNSVILIKCLIINPQKNKNNFLSIII